MNISCILGRVSCSTEGAVVDDKTTFGNSNRWIFDVEVPVSDQTVEVILLDFRSKKPKPRGVLSPHATPLNDWAARMHVCFPEPDRILIQFLSTEMRPMNEKDAKALFRIAVDGLHTLMR